MTVPYLHSHSALERSLLFPKGVVLVDERFAGLFGDPQMLGHGGVQYAKVPILDFVRRGGVFKNFRR